MSAARFRLSKRSLDNLKGVHPDMVSVVKRAIEITDIDYVVIEGVRTDERQEELYAQGRTKPGKIVTWTKNSRHKKQKDGFGHAVDSVALVDGKVNWDAKYYHQINEAMQQAARDLNIKIIWGGTFKTFDGPHWELDARFYA